MKKILLCGLIFLMACNAQNNADQQIVKYNPDRDPISNPQELFSSMRVVSFKCPTDILLHSESDVIYDQDKFYVVDARYGRRVDIFNSEGVYISSVAARGRANNEYINISGAQVEDGMLAIYSYHNKAVYYYDTKGAFVKKVPTKFTPYQLLKIEDGYWGYMGFGNGQMPERVVKMDAEGDIVGKYLPSKAAVIAMEEKNPVFSKYESGVLMRESLRNEIVSIDEKGQVQAFLKFDFGRYNVPDKYFEFSDPFAAGEMLFKSDFAIMDRFLYDGKYSVLSVGFQMGSDPEKFTATLGVAQNGAWKWLKSGKTGPLSMFGMTARQLTHDSNLLLLATGDQVKAFSDKYPELIAEFDFSTEDTYLVVCKLK